MMYRYMYTRRLVAAEAEHDSMQGRITVDIAALSSPLSLSLSLSKTLPPDLLSGFPTDFLR
jgi:hypothetical protein